MESHLNDWISLRSFSMLPGCTILTHPLSTFNLFMFGLFFDKWVIQRLCFHTRVLYTKISWTFCSSLLFFALSRRGIQQSYFVLLLIIPFHYRISDPWLYAIAHSSTSSFILIWARPLYPSPLSNFKDWHSFITMMIACLEFIWLLQLPPPKNEIEGPGYEVLLRLYVSLHLGLKPPGKQKSPKKIIIIKLKRIIIKFEAHFACWPTVQFSFY